MQRGYIQVYTGNGKGKTTAAIGLALRSLSAGYRVYIGQFVKSIAYNEIEYIQNHIDGITVEIYGTRGCIVTKECHEDDVRDAKKGLEEARAVLQSGEYDVVIFDEISICTFFNLFSEEELIDLIKSKPENVELVLTGRYMPDKVLELADLVTDMQEVKHYYTIGVEARDGFER